MPPDPRHVLAIVQTWPDHSISVELAQWLLSLAKPANEAIFFRGDTLAKHEDVITARNRTVAEHILRSPKHFTHFLLLDRDIRPDPIKTQPFLDVDAAAPIVVAEHPIPDMSDWGRPNALHLGICRIRREVFAAVAPPWFLFRYSDDGTQLTACECATFAEKAIAAGFPITRAGWAGHYHRRPGDVAQ